MKLDFIPLGGGREIGANSYLLKWGKYQIILDCGLNPMKSGYEKIPLLQYIDPNKPIDMIFISHSHNDHLGSLPVIVDTLEVNEIITVEGNRDVMNIMLQDSAKVLTKYDQKGRGFYLNYFEEDKIFTIINGGLIKETPFLEWRNLNEEIKYMLFPNGHVIGSSGIILKDIDGNTVVYTGDYALNGARIPEDFYFPKDIYPDILITESTYGDSKGLKIEERKQAELKLVNLINETLKNNGKVLLPAFALGKSQELLVLLLINYDKFVTHPYIRLVGMGKKLIKLIDKNTYYKYIPYINVEKFMRCIDWKPAYDKIPENSIIIATSGMMIPFTPSYLFLEKLLEEKNNLIAFTGYLAKGSFGYELLHTQKDEEISYYITVKHYKDSYEEHARKTLRKKAKVVQFRLSSHSPLEEVLDFIEKVNPKNVVIVHAPEDSAYNTRTFLKNRLFQGIIHTPANGERLTLSDRGILYSSMKRINYIITTGTSLLSNFKNKFPEEEVTKSKLLAYMLDEKPSELCAEINTLIEAVREQKKLSNPLLEFHLLNSDTEDGIFAGELLAEYIKLKFAIPQKRIHTKTIKGLSYSYDVFQKEGIYNFINSVAQLLEEGNKKSIIISTGGFKAETAFTTLLGLLYGRKVYYIHQKFGGVIEIPAIPIEFGTDDLKKNYELLMEIVNESNFEKAKKMKESNLPKSMYSFIYIDKILKRYVLSPIGRVVIRFYRYKSSIVDIGHPVSISSKSKNTIWGREVKSIYDVPDVKVVRILNRIVKYAGKNLEKIVFDKFKKKDRGREVYFEFQSNWGNKAIRYKIKLPYGTQEVVFFTAPHYGEKFVEDIGIKIYP